MAPPLKLYCYAGHDYTPENTRLEIIRRRGREYQVRRCKRCQSIRVAAYQKAKRRAGKPHRDNRISEQ